MMHLKHLEITVEPGFLLAVCVWLLFLPFQWVCAWVGAVAIHELGHCLAIVLSGNRVLSLRIGFQGAKMETADLTDLDELLCALAGPVSGLLLLIIGRFFPRLAICGVIQAAYNLLPIYPLDGGRALRIIVSQAIHPGKRELIIHIIEISVLILLGGITAWGIWGLSIGPIPGILYFVLLVKYMKIKFPCKARAERVQ